MPKKRSKRYEKAAEVVEDRPYALAEAVETLKKFPAPKVGPLAIRAVFVAPLVEKLERVSIG